ncbi:hypothetical protein AB0C29_48170, partial [Actinoplanes sp. NPDC048791]|uniref:hypothetical protein n=1 Tax=Actinoplanes sp. NPDC048791 TaxID=3154623 RepID=UPI0033CA6E48
MTAPRKQAALLAARRLAALVALAAPIIALAAGLEATIQHPANLVTLVLSVAVVTVAIWYALTRRGVLRILGVVAAVLAAAAVVLIGLSVLLLQLTLLLLFALAGRYALGPDAAALFGSRPAHPVGAARHGVLLINPKSGNATAVRLHLA